MSRGQGSKPKSVRQKWKDAWRSSDLHPSARLVLFEFFDYCHRDDTQAQNVWVDHNTLCKETGLSTNTVTKYMALVVALGWLTETRPHAGTRAARYALTTPPASASMVATQGPADPDALESQRLRLKELRETRGLSLNPEVLESQSESSRVSMVEDKPGVGPGSGPGINSGSRGNSPRARPGPETPDPYAADDPFERQQESEPPPHVAAAFAAIELGAGTAGPDLDLCDHGIQRGLTLGSGVLACCPVESDRSREQARPRNPYGVSPNDPVWGKTLGGGS